MSAATATKAPTTKPASVTFTITATQDRVTKNAVRYQEDVPAGVAPEAHVQKIGQIYLQKSALGGAPKRISLVVEVIEN
jgi:hypothetical protein